MLFVFLCSVFLTCSHCWAVFFLWFDSLHAILLFQGFHGRLMIVNICIMLDQRLYISHKEKGRLLQVAHCETLALFRDYC